MTLMTVGQETWIPVIKHLYRLTSDSSSRVTIHSAWVLERPNHGAAALLNEEILKKHYSAMCTFSIVPHFSFTHTGRCVRGMLI